MEPRTVEEATARAGLKARFVRKVVNLGIVSKYIDLVSSCATVVFAFFFQYRSVVVVHVGAGDVEVSEDGSERAKLRYCKAKVTSRPLLLIYSVNPACNGGRGAHLLFTRWEILWPQGL